MQAHDRHRPWYKSESKTHFFSSNYGRPLVEQMAWFALLRNVCAKDYSSPLEQWISKAGIEKHITWSCARLSFSILLQDKNVDDATVAYLMGHTTTEQVRKTYKRHRPKNQAHSISQLPAPAQMPHFLNTRN